MLARVLLVDDHAQVRKLLETVFRRAGFDVTSAEDGETALELQRENPAEVVVTDILMPNKEGFETITDLRRDYPETKIIAISGGGRNMPEHYLEFARSFGADRAFAKPLDMDVLVDAVHELLQ